MVRANGPLLFLNRGRRQVSPEARCLPVRESAAGNLHRRGRRRLRSRRMARHLLLPLRLLPGHRAIQVSLAVSRRRKRPAEFPDAQQPRRHVPRRDRRSGPESEQHALQLLLRVERLQPRRLARPLRRQRFRPQESLPQQWRRNLHRRCAASGSRRRRRGHERLLARLRQRRRRTISTSPTCGPPPESASRLRTIFKKDSPQDVRALYQKHAMGNSLFRESRCHVRRQVRRSSGVGMGRWAWSSDAFDFDHDGFPDLYIANGMVSGPSRPGSQQLFLAAGRCQLAR